MEKLPYGFTTQLGERGTGLPEGQKQRLAIARVLYRDPKMLILGEATSTPDMASEQYVQRTLQQLRAGKTVIAYRLSTVRHADNIAVPAAGKLVEEGTHAQLLTLGGAYYTRWEQVRPAAVVAC